MILQPNDPMLPSSILALPVSDQERAIASAQRLAESNIGAGRPLELTEFTEMVPVSRVMQSSQLSYWPIAEIPVPIISVRQSRTTIYGRSLGTSQWIDVDPENYILDPDGRVHFQLEWSGWGRIGPSGFDEVRARYTSGFDFSLNNYEINQIKGAVADIITAQLSDQYKSGALLSQVEIFEEVKTAIRYNNSDNATTITALRQGLSILKRYFPRGIT